MNNINIVHNANITNMYRNARVVNGVTAVSAGDFQRGNFRNRVTVDRSELQRGSLVRGAVPLTPSADNLRFSNRTAAAVGGALGHDEPAVLQPVISVFNGCPEDAFCPAAIGRAVCLRESRVPDQSGSGQLRTLQ